MWATGPCARRTPNRRKCRHENRIVAGGAGDGVARGALCLLSAVNFLRKSEPYPWPVTPYRQ